MVPNFRAWHKTEKKMFEVRGIHFKTSISNASEICVRTNIEHPANRHYGKEAIGVTVYELYEPMDDFEIIMGTGVKDEKKNEIFIGDIVSDQEDIGVIKYSDGTFVLAELGKCNFEWPICALVDAKIIGNIHANPELREKNR